MAKSLLKFVNRYLFLDCIDGWIKQFKRSKWGQRKVTKNLGDTDWVIGKHLFAGESTHRLLVGSDNFTRESLGDKWQWIGIEIGILLIY